MQEVQIAHDFQCVFGFVIEIVMMMVLRHGWLKCFFLDVCSCEVTIRRARSPSKLTLVKRQ